VAALAALASDESGLVLPHHHGPAAPRDEKAAKSAAPLVTRPRPELRAAYQSQHRAQQGAYQSLLAPSSTFGDWYG